MDGPGNQPGYKVTIDSIGQPAAKSVMGYIYCITSPNGKRYIGQTTRKVSQRFKEHAKCKDCRILYTAITKYGLEQMRVETVLEINDHLLDYYESKFIDMFHTIHPNGYNIRTGGSNGKHCPDSCDKMRLAKLGEKNHNFGKPRTDEAKSNISKAKTGENHHFYGKQLSLNHKLALSRSHKSDDLPMYMVRVKERPHSSGGYAIVNHPTLPCKYFTSRKWSMEDKQKLAYEYLNLADAVQRLNGNRGDIP
jgi:group I intron endonuclease